MMRRRLKHEKTLEQRLADQASRDNEEAARLPSGAERDRLLKKIRLNETTAHLTEWLSSPGLQPPKK